MRYRMFSLLLVLSIPLLTGCLGGQKLTGPTWTTKVTVPLMMREKLAGSQIELGNQTNGLGEAGLALNGKSLNAYNFAAQSWTSEQLGTKTINIAGGAIPNFSIAGLGISLIVGSTYPINSSTTTFQLSDTSYSSITFSNNLNNKIDIDLSEEITASDLNLNFALWDVTADAAVTSTIVNSGGNAGTLLLAGVSLNPSHQFEMKVIGNFKLTGTTDPKIVFTIGSLEVSSFKVSAANLATKIDFDLTQALDFTFEMPQDLLLELSTANLKITPTMPNNLTIGTTLTLTPLDKNDSPIVGFDQTLNLGVMTAKQEKTVDIKAALNAVLAIKPAKIKFSATSPSIAGVGQNITISATDTIRINFDMNMGLEMASTTPTSSAISDDTNLDSLHAVTLVVQNINHSPIDLTLNLILYPDDNQNPNDSPPAPGVGKVEFPITVAANATQTATLKITKAQYQNLIKNKSLCHQVVITNTSGNDLIANTDYLELRARAEVEVLVNKKE